MPLVRAKARYALVGSLNPKLRAHVAGRASAANDQLAADIRSRMARTYKPAERRVKLTVPPGSPIRDW